MLWWYASTCRHLGTGGKSSDPAVWEGQKRSMNAYIGLQCFYAQGIFYGPDEAVHAQMLPDIKQCTIDCFNQDLKSVTRQIRFRLADIGLLPEEIEMEGGSFSRDGDEIEMDVSISAMGHQLVRVLPAE
jgi:hypothetical protein